VSVESYVAPKDPLQAELTTCFGGRIPVLLVGDLNAKHMDWISRLTTRREKVLRDYADGNSCLIFGRDTTTTNTYKLSATPDVLDIVITQNLT
jgi:hypothetical protein